MIVRIKGSGFGGIEEDIKCHELVKLKATDKEIIAVSRSPICALSAALKYLDKNSKNAEFSEALDGIVEAVEKIHVAFFERLDIKEQTSELEYLNKNLKDRLNLEIENNLKLVEELRRKSELSKSMMEEIESIKRRQKLLVSIIKLLYLGELNGPEMDELKKHGLIKDNKIEFKKIESSQW